MTALKKASKKAETSTAPSNECSLGAWLFGGFVVALSTTIGVIMDSNDFPDGAIRAGDPPYFGDVNQIKIASPCSASWDAMAGDERARFCTECSQHVYNLSQMTKKEVEALVMGSEGRLCVRFFQRADGTVMTRDCPVGLRYAKQHLILLVGLAGILLAAAFSILFVGSSDRERPAHEGLPRFLATPIDRVRNWLFPQPPRPAVMGDARRTVANPDVFA